MSVKLNKPAQEPLDCIQQDDTQCACLIHLNRDAYLSKNPVRSSNMENIHHAITAGNGTQEDPFLMAPVGPVFGAKIEREVVETLCGAKYDDILISRMYHVGSLLETVVRDGESERRIYFDLKEANEATRKRRQDMSEMFSSPEGMVLKEKLMRQVVDVLAENRRAKERKDLILIVLVKAGIIAAMILLLYSQRHRF